MVRIAIVLVALMPTSAIAEWQLKRITGPGSVKSSGQMHPVEACKNGHCFRNKTRPFYFEGHPAPNGLPDGKIADAWRYKDLSKAWYILPTRRYDHGILGDAIEAGGLAVETRDGKVITLKLPKDQVFEDRIPRFADLDGDGMAEIVTILSSIHKGGSIAVYSLKSGALKKQAQTPFIGRPYRWLNIAGIADFNGDGKKDIAGVWTPHIGGTLKFWTLARGRLKKIGSITGFSNHFIGSRDQRLSAVRDVNGDGIADLALPSANRKALRIVGFAKGRLVEHANIKLPHKIDKAIAANRKENAPVFTFGLADDSTWTVFN
jgi:hypothetical protein